MLVVAEMKVQYFVGAEFDDLLTLETITVRSKGARVVHQYRLTRGEELVCTGESTVACVSTEGKIRRLPTWLKIPTAPSSVS